MEALFVLLNAIAPLSPELEAYLRSIIRCKIFNPEDIILHAGQVCNHIYFIESGWIRQFITVDGKETTTWILTAGDIFISVESFFERILSEEAIQALTRLVVWGITHAELEEACRRFPEFRIHYIQIKKKYYSFSERHRKDILSLSPEKKYAQLIENKPEILEHVPLKHIYSYLGLSQSTFERARRDYQSGKK